MPSADDERRAWFRRDILPLEPSLRLHAKKFCRADQESVDDLVHDTFAKLIGYSDWRQVENPSAFAARTLRNIALDKIRRRKIVGIDGVADMEQFQFADELPGPEAILLGRDEVRRLAELVGDLPEQCRRVFTLSKVYGLSQAEIAVRLGISVSTVDKHVVRGLRFCSERLGRDGRSKRWESSGSLWRTKRERGDKE